MIRPLFQCSGGEMALPDPRLVLVDRGDGGNLIINPPRSVWERSELTAGELTRWSFFVAASGRAMLDVLAVLKHGCINYWEAGNWALHHNADPVGPKRPGDHRRVHLHLLGRSPAAGSAAWRWGEAPFFPTFAHRFAWAIDFKRLHAEECRLIVARTVDILLEKYGFDHDDIFPWSPCPRCGYPTPISVDAPSLCAECESC